MLQISLLGGTSFVLSSFFFWVVDIYIELQISLLLIAREVSTFPFPFFFFLGTRV